MRKLISLLFYGVIFLIAPSVNAQANQKDPITDSPGETDVFIEKATQVFLQNIDSSIYYFQQGLPFYEKHKNWINYVKCNNGLASCYYYKGDYENSLFFMEQAQISAKENIGENNSAYTSVLNNLAHIHLEKGGYEQALEKYFKALEIEEKMGNQDEVITILNNIGVNLSRKGDLDEAVHYYTQALQSRIDLYGLNDVRVADSYITIARIFQRKNQQDTALILHQKAIDLLTAPNMLKGEIAIRRQISAHLEMASIFADQNSASALKNNLATAQSLSLKHLDQPAIENFSILGQWHSKRNNFTQAQQNLERALDLYTEEYQTFDRHPLIGLAHKDLAQNYFSQKKYKKSLQSYQQSIHHFSEDFDHPNFFVNPTMEQLIGDQDILEILTGKAQCLLEIYHQSKDADFLSASNATYQLTLKMIRLLRQDLRAIGSKEYLSEIVIPIYEGALNALLIKNQQQLSENSLEQAFHLFESSKAILLLESINENTAKGFSGIPDSLLLKDQSLKNDLLFYQKKIREEKSRTSDAKNTDKLQKLKDKLFKLRRRHQELIATFEKDYPRYHQLKYDTHLADIKAVQQKLPNDRSAMIEYFMGKENLYLFYISKKEARMISSPRSEKLSENIDQLRNLLKDPYPKDLLLSYQQFTHIAQQLYQQIVAPLEIPDQIEQLFITPDDQICYIPFEVLLSKAPVSSQLDFSLDNLNYLIKDYRISYNYSATLWLQNKTKASNNRKNFIGFAPSFGTDQASQNQSTRTCEKDQLYQLQCTSKEVQQLGQLLSGETFIGQSAIKENFNRNVSNYRILHLATHSCLDDYDPMENKIFFTDGFLSNYDLYNLHLNADLTVLSACNTGNGPLLRGEGVMSLSRGFIHAGCPSTLISMWAVEDCTTADLMMAYYRQLKNGTNKEEALQTAKLDYLRQADRLHCHPFYWAPFVQFGETQALELEQGFSMIQAGGVCLLGLFFFWSMFLFRKK